MQATASAYHRRPYFIKLFINALFQDSAGREMSMGQWWQENLDCKLTQFS